MVIFQNTIFSKQKMVLLFLILVLQLILDIQMLKEFLKRDINNITKFFHKRGISVEDPDELFEDIVK